MLFDWTRQPDFRTTITETFWRRALKVRRDHPSTRAASYLMFHKQQSAF